MELRRRRAGIRALRQGGHEHDEPVGVGERERLEQDRVHHREDRGVGADAERERGDGGEGEAGAAAQRAQRVTQVFAEAFEHESPPRCSTSRASWCVPRSPVSRRARAPCPCRGRTAARRRAISSGVSRSAFEKSSFHDGSSLQRSGEHRRARRGRGLEHAQRELERLRAATRRRRGGRTSCRAGSRSRGSAARRLLRRCPWRSP